MTPTEGTWLQKDKIKILLLEGISDTAVAALETSGYVNVERLPKALDGADLKKALGGVHLLGIRSRTQLTDDVIGAADSLIAVGCFCIGTNQVDLARRAARACRSSTRRSPTRAASPSSSSPRSSC